MNISKIETEFEVKEYGLHGKVVRSEDGRLCVEYTDGEEKFSAGLDLIDKVPMWLRSDYIWMRAVEDYQQRMEERLL